MSTVQVAKSLQGFVAANRRPACRNCANVKEDHADRMPPYDTASWRCKKGDFYVTAQAICKQYQPSTLHVGRGGSTEEPQP